MEVLNIMGNKISSCLCLKCGKLRKVGRDSREEIIDGICFITCNECGSELYSYKVSVKKSRNGKADHKTRN
jgi:predicted metal-binding protein